MGIQMSAGNIKLRTLLQRQHLFLVFQQHHRFPLGLLSGLYKFRCAHNLFTFRRIQVGILKQAHPEHKPQDPGSRLFHPLPHNRLTEAFTAKGIGLQHRLLPAAAAEHIHAIGQNLQIPFCLRQMLHAMGTGTEISHTTQRIIGDAPVGADHALIGSALAQQVFDHVFAVGIAYIFSVFAVLIPGDGVIGHHGSRFFRSVLQGECTFRKGTHVLFKSSAGINGKFSVSIMGIPSAFAGAAAGPMLDHGCHAVLAPAALCAFRGLQAVAVGFRKGGYHIHIRAHGILQTHPARIGGQIDLGSQRLGNAQGTILSGNDSGKFLHQFHIEGGCHAQTLRPTGDLFSGAGEFCALFTRSMSGIGRNTYRNAKTAFFRQLLQVVVPPGSRPGRLRGNQQEVPQVFL